LTASLPTRLLACIFDFGVFPGNIRKRDSPAFINYNWLPGIRPWPGLQISKGQVLFLLGDSTMSVEKVKQFMSKAQTDKALQSQIQAAPKGAGTKTVAELVKIASKAGFTFTPQDYEEAVNELLEEKHAAGALNDEELALVSGGMMCISSDGSKTCTCCSGGAVRQSISTTKIG
jgi:predicted ribosomally synthesized peptide with nif11-like leader